MSVQHRALLIGLIGPAIQVFGVLWLAVHLLIHHLHDPLDPRHLMFEGGMLTIGAGLVITLICVPVAIEVSRASEAEVALKIFETEEEVDAQIPAYQPPLRGAAK